MEFAYSFLSSWFTPTTLFLLLNLTIGTIFLAARLGSHDSPSHPHQLARANSSSLLNRVRSINLSLYKFDHQHADPDHATARFAKPPSFLDRLRSIGSNHSSEVPESEPEREPETEPEREPNANRKKMTKSASEKIVNGGGEDESAVENRRPVTARVRVASRDSSASSEECVNAKADDFINRFRQQLKLQRLESLKRFSDMIKGK